MRSDSLQPPDGASDPQILTPPQPEPLTAEGRALLLDAIQGAASIGLHFPALLHHFGLPDTIEPAIRHPFLDAARLPVSGESEGLREALAAIRDSEPMPGSLSGWDDFRRLRNMAAAALTRSSEARTEPEAEGGA